MTGCCAVRSSSSAVDVYRVAFLSRNFSVDVLISAINLLFLDRFGKNFLQSISIKRAHFGLSFVPIAHSQFSLQQLEVDPIVYFS